VIKKIVMHLLVITNRLMTCKISPEDATVLGYCEISADKYSCSNIYSWEPDAKRPLGRPRRRREDNVKMEFQEVGCRGMDMIELALDRDKRRAYTVMNFRVP
jgi:hypothetical protein